MIRKLLLAFLFALALTSCRTSTIAQRVKTIELKMTLDEVVAIMGKDYQKEGEMLHTEGNIELISYPDNKNGKIDALYFFRLKGGRLAEWYKEMLHIPPNPKSIMPSKVRKIMLGMSLKQITDIMGSDYRVDGKKPRHNKNAEVITYTTEETLSLNAFYRFRFQENKLVEWYKELKHLSGLSVYPK